MGGVTPEPRRGEVWEFDPDPGHGREQQGRRPGIVVSENWFNTSGADLVFVVPLTTRDRGIPTHVRLPGGGLGRPSVAMCDQTRAIAVERLIRRRGAVAPETLAAMETVLRRIVGF